ncbi:uncharacterized protein BKCO1_5600053 [Diplodia corticola]|uniref:Secreted protein n=1 Tax=Diplodia corticola TaxID=236234 RepID=A0A1J9QQQ3_9PEZI|nr:uncharacterized protein BKCO1_5600053 [Diplodia corticola]OJD30777.1 hypothetical protein BKCO1_5600053 [Diplodia corticola]
MRFSVIAAAAISCAAPVWANAETTIKAVGDVDKTALKDCLDSYRNDNWDGMNCGARGWFKGHRPAYQSSNNCYDACAPGIRSAIDQGGSNVECRDYEGVTQCWMGYN